MLFKNLYFQSGIGFRFVDNFDACFLCVFSSYFVGPHDSYKVGKHKAFLQCGYADERPSSLYVQNPDCKNHK